MGAYRISTTAVSVRHQVGYLDRTPPLYYEELLPADAADAPAILLLTGGGHTGACYQVTPDGRPGWAYRFVQAGYRVVIPDWPGTGRSGTMATREMDGESVWTAVGALIEQLGAPVVVLTHSLSGAYGWKLLELHPAAVAAVVGVAPRPPGNVQSEARLISSSEDAIELDSGGIRWRIALDEPVLLNEHQIRDKLIGASTRFPVHALAAYRASLVPVAPRRLAEGLNVGGSQARAEDTSSFEGKRVLIVTGGADADHPRELDERTIDWLRSVGSDAELCFLPEVGIEGNGHMVMLEDNSDEIVDLIVAWLERAPRGAGPA